MSTSYYDLYVKYRQDELLREAENERLVDSVSKSKRNPLRLRLASTLRTAAQWLEGRPQLANA